MRIQCSFFHFHSVIVRLLVSDQRKENTSITERSNQSCNVILLNWFNEDQCQRNEQLYCKGNSNYRLTTVNYLNLKERIRFRMNDAQKMKRNETERNGGYCVM